MGGASESAASYDGGDGGGGSSIHSNNADQSSFSSAAASSSLHLLNKAKDLSTDLSLSLSITPPSLSQTHFSSSSTSAPRRCDWPPICRSRLAAGNGGNRRHGAALFVKVYLEGVPIGRKLDLLTHKDYDGLIKTLSHMFRTTILWPDVDPVHSHSYYVLTYEDKEGDWMMVGDVPWEMFLSNVKRLKITKVDRC